MGFFKKHGKPAQYRLTYLSLGSTRVLPERWLRPYKRWSLVSMTTVSYGSVESARIACELDAKVRGYGDNYEITELT